MAISISLLERVVPMAAMPWSILLFAGWALEITAMWVILASIQGSESAFHAEIYRTDHMLRTPGHEDPGWPRLQSHSDAFPDRSRNGLISVGASRSPSMSATITSPVFAVGCCLTSTRSPSSIRSAAHGERSIPGMPAGGLVPRC